MTEFDNWLAHAGVCNDPRVRPHRGDGRARLAQAKRRCALRGRPARGGAEANLRDARGACGRPLQPKGRGHGVEVQAELVCPRQGGPDGSPGSATLCLKTHESYHDRSHGVPRPDVVEARRGTRCHPKGRRRSLSVLTLIGGALPRETAPRWSPLVVEVVGLQCPLLAHSGHAQCADECPLLGAERALTNRCLPISIYECTAPRQGSRPNPYLPPTGGGHRSCRMRW